MSSKQLILVVGLILILGGAAIVAVALLSSREATTVTTLAVSTTSTLQESLPGVAELQRGDIAGAQAKARANLEKNPDDLASWFFLARTYEQTGDRDGAMKVYEQLLEADPNNFEAYFHIGQLRLAKKDLEGAAKSFDKALQINNDFTAARVSLAEVDTQLGNTDKAIKLYFEVLDMRPMGVHLDTIRVPLAKLLIKVKQPDNAAIQLNKAVAENPDNVEAKELLAELDKSGGSTPGAAETTSTTGT